MYDFQDEKEFLRNFFTFKDRDLTMESYTGRNYHLACIYSLVGLSRMMISSAIFSFFFSYPLQWSVDYIAGIIPRFDSKILVMLISLAFPSLLFLLLLYIAVVLISKVRDSNDDKIDNWIWGFIIFNSIVTCFFFLIIELSVCKLYFIIFAIALSSYTIIKRLHWIPSLFCRWLIMLLISSFLYLIVYLIWPPTDIEYTAHIFITFGFIYCINKYINVLRKDSIKYDGFINISSSSYKTAFFIYTGLFFIWLDLINGVLDNR